MFAFLASLALLAAAESSPAPAIIVSDPEVPQYLNFKQGEVAEWGRALQQMEKGQQRMQQGNSILNAPRITTVGAFQETPEQAKARAQKIIDEGKAQMTTATAVIERLRRVATTRFLELTKTVDLQVGLTQTKWAYSMSLAAVRLQKIARDGGYKNHHIVGSITVLSDNKILQTPAVTESLRDIWSKADPQGNLAAIPEGGYRYQVGSGDGAPQLSKNWKAPTPRDTTVVWAEVYALTPDNSAVLLIVRMADAFTMRLIGSEIYLTTLGPAEIFAREYKGMISLRDEKSFIPRLANSGDWTVSYEKSNAPLANAILRHLCVTVSKIGVGASQSLVDVLGGDAPSLEGAKASWKILSDKTTATFKTYSIACTPNRATPVNVGILTLKCEEPGKLPDASKVPAK